MAGLSTHVLDTALGRPAEGVKWSLERLDATGSSKALATGTTDADGRSKDLVGGKALEANTTYRLTFQTGDYFSKRGELGFYPRAAIEFVVRDPEAHHHVPLLLSPFGYSTYRGS